MRQHVPSAILSLGLLVSATHAFTASATTNLAVYWGQNSAGSQGTLATYCQDSTIDIIPLAFLTSFGTGDYTINFANACSGSTISGSTLIECDQIAADIKTCQAAGKKILLSMGGASGSYGFSSSAQAVQVANDLWDYFGGGNSTIRPFGDSIVDGFDLDIENDLPAYYPDFMAQMRILYASQSTKTYYISGAPQCVYPDASLTDALSDSYFDFLFIQFYNNWCGVYQYGSSNDAFNYDVWNTWATSSSVNPNVRLYLGVAAATGAANAGTGYVAPSLMIEAAQALQSQYPSTFGGIMMWDASQAYANIPSGYSINYAEIAKEALLGTLSSSTSVLSSSSLRTSTTSSSIVHPTSTLPSSSVYSVSSTVAKFSTVSTSTGTALSTIIPEAATQLASTASSSTVSKAVAATSAASIAGCTEYYTVVSGDYCYAIWTAHGLSSATFYALNPTLSASNDCLIQPGQVLCVSDSGTTQGGTSTSTTTLKLTSTTTTTTRIPTSSTVAAAVEPAVTTSASTSSTSDSSCPVSGGSCSEGSYQCNGYGYAQCVWGAWMLRSCPTGTACAGSGSNIYCDYVGTATVTCAGITGKTNTKRSLVQDEISVSPEVDTSMTSQRLNATHFMITLKARATGIMPITDNWFFSFASEKDIVSTDRGVLYRDTSNSTYTVSADPSVENTPTRQLHIRLVGTYDPIAVSRKSWLF